jgi:hypothetical protein
MLIQATDLDGDPCIHDEVRWDISVRLIADVFESAVLEMLDREALGSIHRRFSNDRRKRQRADQIHGARFAGPCLA